MFLIHSPSKPSSHLYVLFLILGSVLVRCESNQVLTFRLFLVLGPGLVSGEGFKLSPFSLSRSGFRAGVVWCEGFKFSVLIRLLRDFITDDESWVSRNYSALLSLCLFPY